MKTVYIIVLILLITILGCTSQKYAKEETRCCTNCLDYGEKDLSKDCLEVIKEHGGDRHCYLTMPEHPHTLSECKDIIG